MKFKILALLCLLSLLLLLPAQKSYACADLLEFFLSKENVDQVFRDQLLEISRFMNEMEAHLHRKDFSAYHKTLEKVTGKWFDFYARYATKPPAQWVSSKKWLESLASITGKLRSLVKVKDDFDEIHPFLSGMNEDLLSIFKAKVNLSEQIVVNLLEKKMVEIETLAGNTREIQLYNLRTLGRMLKPFARDEITQNSQKYRNARDLFLASIETPSFLTATSPVELNKSREIFTQFQNERIKLLKNQWFNK